MDHPERNDRIIGTKDGAASSPVTKTSNRWQEGQLPKYEQ